MSDELDLLVEQTVTARRARDASGRVLPPPAWWDLAPETRERAFELQTRTREWERAADPDGFSGTVRAVMGRLSGRE